MDHLWGKEIQFCSNKVPRVMYGPNPRCLNFYIVIYREMFKKSSSQEPLGQFQPNLVGNMLGGLGFRFVQIKGLVPFGAQKGKIREKKL